jgi:hypothetical protein
MPEVGCSVDHVVTGPLPTGDNPVVPGEVTEVDRPVPFPRPMRFMHGKPYPLAGHLRDDGARPGHRGHIRVTMCNGKFRVAG